MGEFLQALGPSWEPLQEVTALGQTREPVGEEAEWISPGVLQVDVNPAVRLRTRTNEQDRMIQVENGWLSLNWMLASGKPYPRYSTLRKEFDKHWGRWSGYLGKGKLGELQVNLWEVGYVNVLPRGELWSRLDDWARLLPSLVAPGSPDPGRLQTMSGRWAFLIAPGKGRLQVFLEHALRNVPEPTECLLLRLIARGPTRDASVESLGAGLDLGHETIVRTFAALLSEDARQKLGYRT